VSYQLLLFSVAGVQYGGARNTSTHELNLLLRPQGTAKGSIRLRLPWSSRLAEQQLHVLPQMVDACDSDVAVMFRFGKNERALESGLRVKREALRCPVWMHAAFANRFLDVRDQRRRMRADTAIAGVTNIRVGVVDFLHHGARKAGKIHQLSLQHRLAQVNVSQEPIERVGRFVIFRGHE